MKIIILCFALCCAGCSGCAPRHIGNRTPLLPGDAIIFKGTNAAARANQFRMDSMNDTDRAGSVVEITRPTTVLINE